MPVINGTSGDDQLTGTPGNDTISGLEGSDTINAGAGNDEVDGGADNDTLVGGEGDDILDGGSGIDTASYADAASAVSVTLLTSLPQNTGGAGSDILTRIENLIGSSYFDVLRGDAGANRLFGEAGNDWLAGGAGDDTLDGGPGYDSAILNSFFRASAVGVGSVVSVAGPDGADTLTGIEHLAFTDGDFILHADSAGAKVMRLYDTVLDRPPDPIGLDAWVDQLEDSGLGLVQVASALASSAEFVAATGELSNAAFVDYIYEHALDRASDPGGRANWIAHLENGMSRAEMLVHFSESAEHRALTSGLVAQGYFQTNDIYQAIALLYDSFANRLPDQWGLQQWAAMAKASTLTLAQVADGFAGSQEFRQLTAGMTHAQLVDLMYHNTLDREPAAAERQHWIDQLDQGMTDGQLLLGFSQSSEHVSLFLPHIVGGIDFFG